MKQKDIVKNLIEQYRLKIKLKDVREYVRKEVRAGEDINEYLVWGLLDLLKRQYAEYIRECLPKIGGEYIEEIALEIEYAPTYYAGGIQFGYDTEDDEWGRDLFEKVMNFNSKRKQK